MKKALQVFAQWLLYSHLYIGLCAAALTALTFYLLHIPYSFFSPEIVLGGSGATMVYILHRQIGMMRLEDVQLPDRYRKILHLSHTTMALFFLSGLGLLYAFYSVPATEWHTLILPFFLTLGYLLPIFRGKRVRDFPFIKIALVAIVWSWISVILPALRYEMAHSFEIISLMIIERALFIFGITIPFDIRDIEQDRKSGTKTIPSSIRLRTSKLIAGVSILVALAIDLVLTSYFHLYTTPIFVGFLFTYVLSLTLIAYSRPDLPDWYFTGLVDGLMLVLPISIFMMQYIF